MADNSTLPVNVGTEIFANDDVGGVHYPRTKIVWGVDGTVNDASASNPVPVTSTQSGTWTVQPGNTANTTAWLVNPGLQLNAGAATATTARVTIDTSQVAPLSTTSQGMSAGYTLVGLVSDQPAVSTQGGVGHGVTDAGNPIKNGFKASSSLSGLTLVTNAQRSDAYSGLDGVQIVRTHTNLEDIVSPAPVSDTAGTSTQIVAAQSAGIKTYLTSIILCNTSATNITVNIKDGTTVKLTLPVPGGSGCVFNPPVPIPGTAATAWNFQGSAAAATLTCSVIGFKSKV